jgi:predicted nucleotidyltransferase component of viral defense system
MSNASASVRGRLTSLARKQGLSFQLIIIRYLQERFMYRLSQSSYRNNFYLKGGALIYALEGSKTRFTLDIDFLGREISNNMESIKAAFAEICNLPCSSDSVLFDSESVDAEIISEHNRQNGVRLFIDGSFHTIKQRLQIDIGFGDVVVPDPLIYIEYPVLLSDSDAPVILAYSPETLIAEKFQAMIELSLVNSRMKDFYDVYKVLTSGNFNLNSLEESIKATFFNRKTYYTENHSLFSSEFVTNPNRLQMWRAFLNKIGQNEKLSFSKVMDTITINLKPIWDRLKE